MKRVLLSWIGEKDISAKPGNSRIERAAKAKKIDEIYLLGNIDEERVLKIEDKEIRPNTRSSFENFVASLRSSKVKVEVHPCRLSSPTNYREIYAESIKLIRSILNDTNDQVEFVYHLSSGTAAMITMWIIISKTQYKGQLIETQFPKHVIEKHPENELNVASVEVPFDFTAELLPEIIEESNHKITQAFYHPKAFEKVLGKSQEIREIIRKANLVASRGATVLLEGETGTGKELFAEAIHLASNIADKNFIAINCGAIPENLIESELFGYEKGAFTGANTSKLGLFESANNGTVFLDEIGETNKALQVKLLRVLQSSEVRRVGGSKPIPIKVRVIAATNRDLFQEVQKGNFREDLYYRLAVAVIRIPPLRERKTDIPLLVDEFVRQQSSDLNLANRRLSSKARSLLINHDWPGNVRELINTITSILVWSENSTINPEEVLKVLKKSEQSKKTDVMARPLGSKPNLLEDILKEISIHYFKRALKEAGKNTTAAARLLGFKNYQTFNNKRQKLGL